MKDETSRGEQLVGPVEELSDLQWARVERGLWQRLDAETADAAMQAADAADAADARARASALQRRRRWRMAAMAAGVAAAAAIAFAVWPRGAAPIAIVDNPQREGEPARVVTSESATTVSFADAAIEVQPHSAVLMSGSAERGATVVLESGRAGFQVAPREQRRPFVVMAGHALVRVVGTRFDVERSGEAVSVTVQEGVVDVRYLGEVHQVMAGGQWRSPAASATEETLLDGGDSSAAGDGAAGDGAADAGEPTKPPPATGSSTKHDDSASVAREQAAARAAARARATEFTDAAKLESSAPQQALRRYLELAKQSDRWAQNALYAAARLALDVGQRSQAKTLAQAYLRRFPTGSNAADARALLDALP